MGGPIVLKDFNLLFTERQLTELYAHRAATHYNSGYYERAIDDFNKAIEWQPTNANLHYGHGAAYHKTGDYVSTTADRKKHHGTEIEVGIHYETLINV